MSNRLGSFTLSIVATVGMLQASVLPAAACSCGISQSDDQTRELMAFYEVVAEGELGSRSDGPITFLPTTVYRGDPAAEIRLGQTWQQNDPGDGLIEVGPDCRFFLSGEPGTRYLLFLKSNGDSYSVGGPCASFPLDDSTWVAAYAAFYESVQRVARDEDQAPQVPPLATENPPVAQPSDNDVVPQRSVAVEEPIDSGIVGQEYEAIPISAPMVTPSKTVLLSGAPNTKTSPGSRSSLSPSPSRSPSSPPGPSSASATVAATNHKPPPRRIMPL